MVAKNAIVQAVKAELQRLYGDRLAKLILYGSYARGDFHEESDIDFLIVLNDEEIDVGRELRTMSHPLYKISYDNDIYISISKHPTTLYVCKTLSFYSSKISGRRGSKYES